MGGPLGIGCFYLGWWWLGLACLFLLGFSCFCIPCIILLLRTSCACVVALVQALVNCLCCGCCNFVWQGAAEGKNEDEIEQIKQDYAFACCASFLSVLGVIFWVISLVEISNNCT